MAMAINGTFTSFSSIINSIIIIIVFGLIGYCIQLKRDLARMTELRETERRGRTSAERALRSGVKEKVKSEGFNTVEIGQMKTPFGDRRGTPRQGKFDAHVVFVQ
jgi:hypothetical protein